MPYTCSGAHTVNCNGLLYGSSAELIGALDNVMRSAARLILKRQQYDRISTLMRNQSVLRVAARLILRLPSRSSVSASMHVQLHWLNMDESISFKIDQLAYKSIQGLAPA